MPILPVPVVVGAGSWCIFKNLCRRFLDSHCHPSPSGPAKQGVCFKFRDGRAGIWGTKRWWVGEKSVGRRLTAGCLPGVPLGVEMTGSQVRPRFDPLRTAWMPTVFMFAELCGTTPVAGVCHFGEKCRYSHEVREKRVGITSLQAMSRASTSFWGHVDKRFPIHRSHSELFMRIHWNWNHHERYLWL